MAAVYFTPGSFFAQRKVLAGASRTDMHFKKRVQNPRIAALAASLSSTSWRFRRRRIFFIKWFCAGLLVLSPCREAFCAETEDQMPPPAVGSNGETNSQQTLEALLRIEARLRSNELAIASNGAEAQLAAARNAEAVGKALQTLGGAIAVQQEALSTTSTRELEAIHGSNRFMLIVAGSFAALTCLAMLVMAYFQWRSSRIWSDISSGLKNGNGAGGMGGALASLPAAGLSPASVSAGDASSRLLGAMEQLERRLQLLEGVTRPALHAPLPEFIPGENGDELENYDGTDQTNGEESVSGREHRRIATLLKEGQARLKDNDLQAALHCYDEVLAIEPDQPEALVKKGVALERLHKLNEAFECYDRAITVDGSSTIAYLHKGGLCNRLERFKEALECYEKALQIHNEARD